MHSNGMSVSRFAYSYKFMREEDPQKGGAGPQPFFFFFFFFLWENKKKGSNIASLETLMHYRRLLYNMEVKLS